MSRYFRYIKQFRTYTALRCSGCIYSYQEINSKILTVMCPNQVCCFSVKVPTMKTIFHSDEEKFSDSDSESDGERNTLISVIKVGKPLTSLEWENVKTETCSKVRGLNPRNIDAVVMMYCNKHKQFALGLSYLEHLSQIGKKPNIATVAYFMRLCYNCQDENVDEQLILSLYDGLRGRFPVLDASTSESVILGLCLTNRWQESLEFMDMIKLTCSPGGLEYNAIIRKAFDNNEVTIGKKYLEEMLQIGRLPRPEVYLSWLNYLERLSNGNKQERWKMIEIELLQFLESNDLKPTCDVAERLRVWYQEVGSGYNAEFTSLTPRGNCKSCNGFLNPIRITDGEFRDLQSAFLEKVVIGKDVFSKTNPTELENFKKFVRNTAPYDMVLDGLNIAYISGTKNGPKNFALSLQQVVRHFYTNSQKLLVLGRKHMQSWPKHYMSDVYRYANVFLAQNVSQDDPFLLYAALYSGPGTNFLSRDLMRGHSYLLKNKDLKSIFRRWQLQHQYQIQYITHAGNLRLKPPLSFNPSVQKNSDGSWHIPYDTEYSANPGLVFDAPTTWLCLPSRPLSKPLA